MRSRSNWCKSVLPFRIGHPCPDDFNPSDHYIHKLSVLPKEEEESRERIDHVCEQFEQSSYGEDTCVCVATIP